jgi:quercetin dioxygenase-like cupin family protein
MRKEKIIAGQLIIDFLAEAEDTNGAMTMFEFTVPSGAKMPVPHYHEKFDETLYGVSGIMTYTVNGQRIEIAPGDTYFVPRGAIHGFENLHREDAKVLAVITPALLGPEYFREIAEVANVAGPPDTEKLKTIMANYGLIPVPPKS